MSEALASSTTTPGEAFSQPTPEQAIFINPGDVYIPEHQLPGKTVEESAFKPETEQFALELENVDKLLLGTLGVAALVADRGGDAGMANLHAFADGFRRAKGKIIERLENVKDNRKPGYVGPPKFEKTPSYREPNVSNRLGEQQWLSPHGLGELRLAIEGDVRNATWQAHTRGDQIGNGFNRNKLASEVTDKYLAKYFGVTPEELSDNEKVPEEMQQVQKAIRGMLSLPMHQFMALSSQLRTPEGRASVLARNWEAKKLRPEQVEMLDALERHPGGKIDLAEIEPEYRDYFEEAKIKELSQKLTVMLEDEAHIKKDDPNRGYDLEKDERTGKDKIPDPEWEKVKKEVKAIAIRTYLPTDAPEDLRDKVSDALYLLALKEGRIRQRKKRR